MPRWFKLPIDPYIVAMAGTVVLASLLPASGMGAVAAGWLASLAIAFLFFLYGARLSPSAAFAGLSHWRLHGTVLLCTYGLFPLLGLGFQVLVPRFLSPDLYLGFLFLCVLPSTVQSSIAFTSIAQGNVAAALCSASASNILGIFLTPLLVGVLLQAQGGDFSWTVLRDIVVQLLLPFVAGQILRPWIGAFVQRHKSVLSLVDRGSILIVIYTAFSEGVVNGIWQQLQISDLMILIACCCVLLAVVIAATTILSRRVLGFSREDEIVVVFCGSKKSLASGLPMAGVLFAGTQVGLVVLPLMLFHQIQLMVCAVMARRYARYAMSPAAAAALAVGAEDEEFSPVPQHEDGPNGGAQRL